MAASLSAPNPMQATNDASAAGRPSSHRLPTVSASQALHNLAGDRTNDYVQTGLRTLDAMLAGVSDPESASIGGFERGKVTELWGPKGAGKTALALQAAANVVAAGGSASWVDATKPLPAYRADSAVFGKRSTPGHTPQSSIQLHHISVSSLSHLLAFVLRPSPKALPTHTSLLILDGLNALVDLDYPRYQLTASNKTDQQKWLAGRRYGVLGSLITALNKVALLDNLAVVVTTSCSTRMRSDGGFGAALVPGVGGQEWDAGIWNRLVVFRDFASRFVGVQKCSGKSLISREEVGEVGRLVPFDIDRHGSIQERQAIRTDEAIVPLPRPTKTSAHKRAFEEIADSEDEDADEYGWIDTDEHALAMESLVEQTEQADGEAEPS